MNDRFTIDSIEAASYIYEDCRARGQSSLVAMRKAVGRLIPQHDHEGRLATAYEAIREMLAALDEVDDYPAQDAAADKARKVLASDLALGLASMFGEKL